MFRTIFCPSLGT